MSNKKNDGKAHIYMKDGEVYVTIDGEVLSDKEASEFNDDSYMRIPSSYESSVIQGGYGRIGN